MLLRQILSERHNLFEDYGNLKVIDKRILRSLLHDDFSGSTSSVGVKAGRDSKIEEISITEKFVKYLELVLSEKVRAIIITIDDYPILAIGYAKEDASSKYSRSTRYVVSKTKVKAMTINDGPGSQLELGDAKLTSNFLRNTSHSSSHIITKASAIKLFDAVKRKSITERSVLRGIFIYPDEDREKKNTDRIAARKGMIPQVDSRDRKDYENELRKDLKRRLDAYKNSRSPTFATLEEMLEAIRKDGAFQKMRFMDITYNRDGEEGSINDIVDFQKPGRKWAGGWAIRYRNDWQDPALDVIRQNRRDRIADLWMEKIGRIPSYEEREKDPELKLMYDQITEQADSEIPKPPDYIYISYKPEGGSIVPDKISSTRPF